MSCPESRRSSSSAAWATPATTAGTGGRGPWPNGSLRCRCSATTTTEATTQLDRDFSEFIACCTGREVRFLIVGGYALAAHGHPRFTKNLDVWLWIDDQNLERLVAALDDFGFGSLGLTVNDFSEPDTVVQLGYPPKRIDLLTSIDGVAFDEAWDARSEAEIDGLTVPFLSRRDLILNKRAAGRLQDVADVAALEADDESPRGESNS